MKKLTIACLIVAFLVTFIGLQLIADMGSKLIFESTKKAEAREFTGWHGEQRTFFDGEKIIYE